MAATASTMPTSRNSIGIARLIWKILFFAIVILLTVATAFPMYWMLLTSIRPDEFSVVYPPSFWPQVFDLSAFGKVFATYPLLTWLIHSGGVALLATALCLIMSILGAYPLACLKWKGRGAFGFFLFFSQMMPETMIVIPIFVIYRRLHLVESLPALSLIDAAFNIPIGIWILKNVFESVPVEVREAALVDGVSVFGVLWRIVIPLSGPGLVAVSVVAFFYAWNEYLFASTLITIEDIRTASVGLATFITMGQVPVQRILAGGVLYALPPAVFYLVAQRNIVTGLTAGAVKG
jgi:multiple sugar transport system permease protein